MLSKFVIRVTFLWSFLILNTGVTSSEKEIIWKQGNHTRYEYTRLHRSCQTKTFMQFEKEIMTGNRYNRIPYPALNRKNSLSKRLHEIDWLLIQLYISSFVSKLIKNPKCREINWPPEYVLSVANIIYTLTSRFYLSLLYSNRLICRLCIDLKKAKFKLCMRRKMAFQYT